MRILLADDHPMIRTALDVLLRDTEFEIVGTATTGEEALARMEEVRPDAVVLDLQMPGGSGMDVLRKSSRDGKRPVDEFTVRCQKLDRRSLARKVAQREHQLRRGNPAAGDENF